MKVALGVTRIGFDGAPRVQLGILEIKTALFVVTLVRSQVDSRPRSLPERFVVLGIFLDRCFIMLQSSGSVHGDVFFVAKRDVIGGRLRARNRGCEQQSCRQVLKGAHMNSDYEVLLTMT